MVAAGNDSILDAQPGHHFSKEPLGRIMSRPQPSQYLVSKTSASSAAVRLLLLCERSLSRPGMQEAYDENDAPAN